MDWIDELLNDVPVRVVGDISDTLRGILLHHDIFLATGVDSSKRRNSIGIFTKEYSLDIATVLEEMKRQYAVDVHIDHPLFEKNKDPFLFYTAHYLDANNAMATEPENLRGTVELYTNPHRLWFMDIPTMQYYEKFLRKQ